MTITNKSMVEQGGVLGIALSRQLKMTQDAMCVRYSNTKSQVSTRKEADLKDPLGHTLFTTFLCVILIAISIYLSIYLSICLSIYLSI